MFIELEERWVKNKNQEKKKKKNLAPGRQTTGSNEGFGKM